MPDSAGAAPEIFDLEAPDFSAAPTLAGPPVTPLQRIYFYEAAEWERFIREWATGVSQPYVQIKQLGGPNDRGVDIAGFKTDQGFQGPWDCYQGKHYAVPLTWSDAFPEILKVLLAVVGGHYVLPDRYAFLAPRGCGPSLNQLLSRPSDLLNKFIEELARAAGPAANLSQEQREKVAALAESTDFAVFQSVELLDALETHRGTPYFVARFGGPMPPRPDPNAPPIEIEAHENRYVAQLLEVYAEQAPGDPISLETASTHGDFGDHFQRQRISFYSAESLRLHARDSVPPGTFEELQADVLSGVVEVAGSTHPTGLDRLTSVLTTSVQLDLSSHALMSVSRMDDRKGICHQLANEDRLTWVKGES